MVGTKIFSCTLKDFQNYPRDMEAPTKDIDGHMFTDILKKGKEVNPGFFFACQVDKDNQLENVYWSDSLSRKRYALFGDILSFGTTLQTDKYSIVFASFTG